jgi:GntR family transcriptional regulator
MPGRFFTQPLYLQLRDALAERIASGEWKAGDVIPNEIDLAQELGVSQGTVRRALDLLESEHVVTRRQGRGTFVNDPRSQELAHRFDGFFLADGAAARTEASTLKVVIEEASDCERARLQLPTGANVYRISRIRSHLGKSFLIECASLPATLFPQLVERAVQLRPLVEIAQAYSLLLGKAEERILVGVCSPSAAEALNLAEGTHVLMLDRIIWTRDKRPAEWRRAECVLDGMYYQARLG